MYLLAFTLFTWFLGRGIENSESKLRTLLVALFCLIDVVWLLVYFWGALKGFSIPVHIVRGDQY